jgi:hypothetical protein
MRKLKLANNRANLFAFGGAVEETEDRTIGELMYEGKIGDSSGDEEDGIRVHECDSNEGDSTDNEDDDDDEGEDVEHDEETDKEGFEDYYDVEYETGDPSRKLWYEMQARGLQRLQN